MQDSQSLEQAKLFFISGLEKLNRNDLSGAEIDFESSLGFAPNRLSIIVNLSIVLIKANKLKKAEKIIHEGLVYHAKNKDLLFSLVEIYKRIISLNKNYAEVYVNLGNVYRELNMYEESLQAYNNAIRLKPNLAESYANRGNVLQNFKKYKEALEDYNAAINIKPDYAEAYSHKGNAQKELFRYEEALENQNKAIEINPNYAEAYYNKGVIFGELNQIEQSLASYDQAIEINPNYAEAYYNKSLNLLTCGDFNNGLNLYEWRWKVEELRLRNRSFTQPLWLGNENIQNKTILLHADQGLGDTIQFCRYAKFVKDSGARVLLEVPKALLSLLNELEGVDQLIESGNELPNFDFHCPLISLPLAFKTELASIPTCTPYLVTGAQKRKVWAQRLGNKIKPLVGLVWSGNNLHKNDHNRSLTLQQLLPYLSDLCEYVSLQKELREIDKVVLDGSSIKHFGDELNDFSDTAALCELMDLVISVDTSVAHLAGAMGKTTWVLLPHVPDWRWLLDREDSPWYPSMKIYRQPVHGDWGSVIQRVRQDLIEYSNNCEL